MPATKTGVTKATKDVTGRAVIKDVTGTAGGTGTEEKLPDSEEETR